MSVIRRTVRLALLTASIVSVVGCDRVTKHIASESLADEPSSSYFFDFVRIVYAENTGGLLSLGAQLPDTLRFLIFVPGTGLVVLLLCAYAFRQRWRGWKLYGLALLLSGGASNWVDRVTNGSVVDFLNVGIGPLRTGIFNVADMAILAGIGFLILGEARQHAAKRSGSSHPA